MKSILVVGMGRFGTHLALMLSDMNNEVLVIDRDEDVINACSTKFYNAQIGDCTNEAVLNTLGVKNFDICFVTIGDNFQSSLEITSLLKEMGAKYVVSKASRDIQAKFLLKNGADEIVYLEKDMAHKLAVQHSMNNIFEYIQLSDEYSIFETPVLSEWVSKSIGEIGVRAKHNLNILAIKRDGKIVPITSAETKFHQDDHIVLMGKNSDVQKLTENI